MICENYQGIKPNDIPKMSMDDILVLTLERKLLLNTGFVKMTVEEARNAGVKMPPNPTGKSLAKMVREQHDEDDAINALREELKAKVAYERRTWKHSKAFKPSRRARVLANEIDQRAKALKAKWIDSV